MKLVEKRELVRQADSHIVRCQVHRLHRELGVKVVPIQVRLKHGQEWGW